MKATGSNGCLSWWVPGGERVENSYLKVNETSITGYGCDVWSSLIDGISVTWFDDGGSSCFRKALCEFVDFKILLERARASMKTNGA